MRRYLITSLVLSLSFVMASPVFATVMHFSEDFEGHALGSGITSANGWFLDTNGFPGGSDRPSVSDNESPLSGQFGDGTVLVGGSGDSKTRNSAGISGGLDNTREYTLKWTWKVNTQADEMDPRNTHASSIGFAVDSGSTRPSIQVNQANGGTIVYNSATDTNAADNQEIIGFGNDRTLDIEMYINGSEEGYRIFEHGTTTLVAAYSFSNGNLANIMPARNSIFWFVNSVQNNPTIDNGLVDDIMLISVPEPGSLVLLALGGLLLAARRR